MATLFLKVTNQSLEASLDIPKIVENSINYLTIHKEYTSDWDGLAIKYLFTCEEETYEWFNDDVPDYVIKSPGFVVSMVGFTEDDNGIITERITTNPVPVYVYSSGKINGKTLSDEEVRAKLVEVFATTIQNTKNIAETASATANEAKKYVDEQTKSINGIKTITEEINAGDLDYGVYCLDGENGVVLFPDREMYGGMLFVSFNANTGKQILTLDGIDDFGAPKLEIFPFEPQKGYNEYNGAPDAYVSKTYVDSYVTDLERQIAKIPKEPSDWNENDPENPAYIKNRTHWKEEKEADYAILPYATPIQGLGLAPYGKRLGLEMNKTYTIECEIEGQIITLEATTTEMPSNIIGVVVPDVVYLYLKELDLKILDGIDGDFATGTLTGTDNCFYNFTNVLPQIKIYGVQGVKTVYHKIPKEYLPDVVIPKDFIDTEMLKDNSITTDKVLDGSITRQKIEQPVLLYDSILSEEVTFINYFKLEGSRFRIIMNRVFVNLEAYKEYNDNIEVIVNGATIKLPLEFTPSNIAASFDIVFDIDISTVGVVEASFAYYETGISNNRGFAKGYAINQSLQKKQSITLGSSFYFRAGTDVKLYKVLS